MTRCRLLQAAEEARGQLSVATTRATYSEQLAQAREADVAHLQAALEVRLPPGLIVQLLTGLSSTAASCTKF